ncbi:hypothetical protein Clacol_003056 [Clathrus columnatus]|uniref:Uncharacterized protein n=1 Tax=Clathrus columnatus TaxID=1419009 RepID=A0AAV5A2H6_9AGAM|nr:hypothetical protein Clacol_003056 [Clathrus columnatus]
MTGAESPPRRENSGELFMIPMKMSRDDEVTKQHDIDEDRGVGNLVESAFISTNRKAVSPTL